MRHFLDFEKPIAALEGKEELFRGFHAALAGERNYAETMLLLAAWHGFVARP